MINGSAAVSPLSPSAERSGAKKNPFFALKFTPQKTGALRLVPFAGAVRR